jgi:hypothetical protein
MYGLPSLEKAEVYSKQARRRLKKLISTHAHPELVEIATADVIVWTNLARARNTKLMVDERVKYYEEILECLRGCCLPRPAIGSDDEPQ